MPSFVRERERVRPCADGLRVERRVEELVRIEAVEKMPRQDADGEIGEERRVRLLELELDGQRVAGGDDDALHELRECGVALEAGVGDGAEREDNVLRVERFAVLPRDALAQVEDVALSVVA